MKTPLLPSVFLFVAIHGVLLAAETSEPDKPAAAESKAKAKALPDKIDFEALRRETGIAPITIAPNAATEADFHLTKRGDTVNFSLGGEEAFTDYKMSPARENSPGEGPYIGIGASALSYGTKMEITGLEVRKLAGKK